MAKVWPSGRTAGNLPSSPPINPRVYGQDHPETVRSGVMGFHGRDGIPVAADLEERR